MVSLERTWASAILASFAPVDGPGLAPRPGEVDYLPAVEALLTHGAPLSRLGLRLALWMVALSPLFVLGRLCTFAGLAPGERPALLAQLLEHRVFPLREGTFLLKTAASLALLGMDSVRARSHYDGHKPRSLPLAEANADARGDA